MHLKWVFGAIGCVLASIRVEVEQTPHALTEYLLGAKMSTHKNYETIALIMCGSQNVAIAVSSFLKYNWYYATIVADISQEVKAPVQYYLVKTVLCFAGSLDDFGEILDFIKLHPAIQLEALMKFVLVARVDRIDWVRKMMEFIWSNRILNYVIVYQFKEEVQIVGYNPFNNSVLHYQVRDQRKFLYADKLVDMYGYQLNCGMVEDIPRNTVSNGKLAGQDVNLLYDIGARLNATINLVLHRNFKDLIADLRSNHADLSFTQVFTISASPLVVVASYPVSLEYITVMVPTSEPIPQYLSIFHVYQPILWGTLLLVFLLMVCTNRLTTCSSVDSALTILRISLQIPDAHLRHLSTSRKLFLAFSMLYSLLLVTAFQSELRSTLVTPQFAHQLATLQELQESGLQIAVNRLLFKGLADNFRNFSKNLIPMRREMISEILSGRKDIAFIFTSTYTNILSKKRDVNNRVAYKVLDEYLGAGHSVYNFAEDSPFKSKIERELSWFREFGIGGHGLVLHDKGAHISKALSPMSLLHLQAAFYALLLGCCLSSFVFSCEIGRSKKFTSRPRPFLP